MTTMTHPDLRPGMPPLPEYMLDLPIDERGYPIPFFVYRDKEGKPDFRIGSADRMRHALKHSLCWVCGKPFTNRRRTFVIGPMCAVNRLSAEPPSHIECARFSAMACPFLTMPKMRRRDNDLPEDLREPAGTALLHNPGVTLVWTTRSFQTEQLSNGVVFTIGDPMAVEWYTEGRPATRAEAEAAFERGLPHLRKLSEQDGAQTLEEIEELTVIAKQYLPTS